MIRYDGTSRLQFSYFFIDEYLYFLNPKNRNNKEQGCVIFIATGSTHAKTAFDIDQFISAFWQLPQNVFNEISLSVSKNVITRNSFQALLGIILFRSSSEIQICELGSGETR